MEQRNCWLNDSDVTACMQCSSSFSPIIRRHHCRCCGGIFCDICCCDSMLIPFEQMAIPSKDFVGSIDPHDLHRVCCSCAKVLDPQQEELSKVWSKSAQELRIERASMSRYLNAPITFSLEDEIEKATYTLYNFTRDNRLEGADFFPSEMIREAKGLAFVTVAKAGFLISGRFGTGCVIGRLPDQSWSAPTAICLTGIGWGFQIGGEVTDLIIFLKDTNALKAFSGAAQLSLGTGISASLGPIGRMASAEIGAGEGKISSTISYAHSKGLFLGVSIEAGMIFSRPDINETFYGFQVSAYDLLRGKIAPPKAAEALYEALDEIVLMDENCMYQDTFGEQTTASFSSSSDGDKIEIKKDKKDEKLFYSSLLDKFFSQTQSLDWVIERGERIKNRNVDDFANMEELSLIKMYSNTENVTIEEPMYFKTELNEHFVYQFDLNNSDIDQDDEIES